MERGMQFPPYLYELFKRVKSIVVPEFLLYDFFFHVKSCPISGSVADPALTGTRATTLFSEIVPNFCRLDITYISVKKYEIFPCPISGSVADPALTGSWRKTYVFWCHGLCQKNNRQRRPKRTLQR